MERSEIISCIKNLINEGTSILENYPNKASLSNDIKQLKQQYKRGNPANLPKLFGIKRLPFEAGLIRQGFQINHEINLNNAIEQRQFNHNMRLTQIENRFTPWYNTASEALRAAGLKELVPSLINAKSLSRCDSKFRKGIAVLEKGLHMLNDDDSRQKPLLIEKGQPLTGLNHIKRILAGAESFVKIQEPYADMELLEAIESTDRKTKVSLLLGKTNCSKEEFDRGLDKLKRSGRLIETVFVLDGANAPFHDRFIFTKGKAFSVGTSMNGLGLRDSSIIQLNEWEELEARFDQYFKNKISLALK